MTIAELRAILADHPAERTVVICVDDTRRVEHFDVADSHTDQPPMCAPVLVLNADWPGDEQS